jgi:Tol biopolymer transport system component
VDRSADPQQLLLSPEDEFGLLPMSWSPDGSVIACERRRGERQEGDIWILPIDDPENLRPLIVSPARESWARFSPDGRWIAYVSNETGRDEVYVQEYLGLDEPSGGRWAVSTNGGTRPFWSSDGTELFFEDLQERLVSFDVEVDDSFHSSSPIVILDAKTLGATGFGDRFHVTPDGQRFAFIQKGVDEGEVTQVNLVLNWSEELERRVPSGGN